MKQKPLTRGISGSLSMHHINVHIPNESKKMIIEDLPHHVISSRIPVDIAITGEALDILRETFSESFITWLICRTRIFARCKPFHKTQIIEKLISEEFVVGMCGDGTNDVGALKAAHVGLALSDTEASMVAPFTSASKSIADVPILLAEGRCALETSFVSFKYMIMYPIIQLTITGTLYSMGTG